METRKSDEPTKTELVEQSSAAGKAYDPGWNDPPPMSYESASGPVKKGILNKPKRIAFPLDSSHSPKGTAPPSSQVVSPNLTPNFPLNSSNQSPVPPLSMPPMHSRLPPSATSENTVIKPTNDRNDDIAPSSNEKTPNKEYSVESVQAVFNNILVTVNESKDVIEIKKRIGVMTQMWKSNKLDLKVQHQMFLFAEALKEGRLVEANEIQKSVAVNHSSQCSTWMAGVRKLVQYASSENTTVVQESNSLGHTEHINNEEFAEGGSDISDVNVLASKVQDL